MALIHSNLAEHRGEQILAEQLAQLDDSRLHLWFGLSYLPDCPDVDAFIWHEGAGCFVVEIKAVPLGMIEKYGPRFWKCRDRKQAKSPPSQAYDAMIGFRTFLHRSGLSWVPFLASTVCWPLIKREEWQEAWPDQREHACRMLFAEDLSSPANLLARLQYVYCNPPVRTGSQRPFVHRPSLFPDFIRILSPEPAARKSASTVETSGDFAGLEEPVLPPPPAASEQFQRVEPLARVMEQHVHDQKKPDDLSRFAGMFQQVQAFYERHRPSDLPSAGGWGRHIRFLEQVNQVLSPIQSIDPSDKSAWPEFSRVEDRLRSLFEQSPAHGSLSRGAMDQVSRASQEMLASCRAVELAVNDFVRIVNRTSPEGRENPEVKELIAAFRDIKHRIVQDLRAREHFQACVRRVEDSWNRFLALRAVLAVENSYRPALIHVDRLNLSEQQEMLVERNYQGEFRLQGASGSGKTVILLHRALRLARENAASTIRIFTINRALANLLAATLRAIGGSVPENLEIAAIYDFLRDVVSHFDFRDRYRLVDERSGERIEVAWRDFYNHAGARPETNVFAHPSVASLRQSLRGRSPAIDDSRYLREEMAYIQSGWRIDCRTRYLEAERNERSVPFSGARRAATLQILEAWEEYLDHGDLCDIDGLTLRASEYFWDDRFLAEIRSIAPTDFVMIDEVQDFSTVELGIVRRLVSDQEAENAFFFVGDLNQKVYAKRHVSREAGFDFRGKALVLSRNFRNTRQILQAAWRLPACFPARAEESFEILDPELSAYDGGPPFAIRCSTENHVATVMAIVEQRKGNRTAVVSENRTLLSQIHREAAAKGLRCFELFCNADIDLWREQQDDALSAALVVSPMEAVKGFEFDTVIACDLSEGVVPAPAYPEQEYWRQAAVVYCALTRARDELLITYVGNPSVFVQCMHEHICVVDAAAELRPSTPPGISEGVESS